MAFTGMSVSNSKIEIGDGPQFIKLQDTEVADVKSSADLTKKIQAKRGKPESKPVWFHKDPDGNVVGCVGEEEDWARYDAVYLAAKGRQG